MSWCIYFLWTLGIVFITCICWWFIRTRQKSLYYGMYPTRGLTYWPKYFLLKLILKEKQTRRSPKALMYDHEERHRLRESERMHPPKHDGDDLEVIYFYGSEVSPPETSPSDGRPGYALAMRLARYSNQTSTCEFWFSLRLPNGSCLTHPRSPLTVHRDYSTTKDDNGDLLERWSVDTGCTILCLSPMKRWRLKYTGFLKKEGSSDDSDLVHVDLDLTFRAFTASFPRRQGFSGILLADALARESWSGNNFRQARRLEELHKERLEQWGSLEGHLTTDHGHEHKLRLKGNRQHICGSRDVENFYRRVLHHGVLEDGSCFTLGTVSYPETLRHCKFGYFVKPYGKMCPVGEHTLDLWNLGEVSPPDNKYSFKFFADGKYYQVDLTTENEMEFRLGQNGNVRLVMRFVKYRINGRLGHGVCEYAYSTGSHTVTSPLLRAEELENTPLLCHETTLSYEDAENVAFDNAPHCIAFTHPGCLTQLAGGKGRQLAFLTQAHKEINVPEGFVISIEAYSHFIENNPQLKKLINNFEKGSAASPQLIQEGIKQGNIEEALQQEILQAASTAFGDAWSSTPLAVRSSAADEDGCDASSAGQMETYLGVLGEDQLMKNIKNCWASLYSAQAVEYRSQYGLSDRPRMAVVVQKLVPSSKAGVIFTSDPRNGDPTQMVINASFGLGESVVSGECEPDTYLITRYPNGKNVIREKSIGDKRMLCVMQESGGVVNVATESGDSQRLCLNDGEIEQLIQISLLIEQVYSSPRDIEWAIDEQGRLFILQARPITTMLIENNEELVHEFDSSLSFDGEYVTTANIGEMMPSAVTPLTLSVFADAIDAALQYSTDCLGSIGDYVSKSRFLPSHCNHLFMNLSMLALGSELYTMMGKFDAVFLSLMGRIPERPTLDEIEYFVGRGSFWHRLKAMVVSNRVRMTSETRTRVWETRLKNGYSIPKQTTARDQIMAIDKQLDDYYLCWSDSIGNSSRSAVWSMVMMSILAPNGAWTNDLLTQVALLLSSCENVYSADVPTSLRKLAKAIQSSKNLELFLQMNQEEQTQWVLSPESEDVYHQFQDFLRLHGHRCVREAEFREVSWRSQPSKVIGVLKSIIESGTLEDEKESLSFISAEDAIDRLTIPLNPIKKRILKWILPKAREGVALREWGKSLAIQMVDVFKEAYKHLGQLCVSESLLPDADLVYFLTHEELLMFLETNADSPSGTSQKKMTQLQQHLMTRAQRRRRILPDQMSVSFPEIQAGFQEPTDVSLDVTTEAKEKHRLTGMTVSRGSKVGVARVVTTLQDAAHIQRGDILVVPYTDVGWTPYFPLISGLVTEKGGLLSHGAVVAREFGLPCIVGVSGATKVFETGEKVHLNSTEGYIERVA